VDNRSLIYWKWDDNIFDGKLVEKIEDLCSRTQIGAVFVGLHWIKKPFDDPELISTIEIMCKELHKRGRKLYIEVCPRCELATFESLSSDACYLTGFYEHVLDEDGNGAFDIKSETLYHYWRTEKPGRGRLLSAFAINKTGEHTYEDASLGVITDNATLSFGEIDEAGSTNATVSISAGKENAGKTVVVFYGEFQAIPDIASPDLVKLFEHMLKSIAHIPIDGVCSDEWGYDVILKVEKLTNYYHDVVTMRHISVSDHLASRYRQEGGGELYTDLFHMYYCSPETVAKSCAVRANYFNALRSIMAQNDQDMYRLSKATFGSEVFFGVHPTWWGSEDQQFFEFFKNGFYWWEARRDIAQTDEVVLMPIRTALAHKWGSPFWYNMWYSMGTRDINTYYRETWSNSLYGGRTHYLGYECPNEDVVLELKPEGMLETIEAMDSRVRILDKLQHTQPDCRVLLLFSIEAAQSWPDGTTWHPPFDSNHNILRDSLRFAKELFADTLCDIVPTSEIRNGSLSVCDGKAVYGSQTYDGVIVLFPDLLEREYFTFLRSLDPSRLLVMGAGSRYSNGEAYTAQDHALATGVEVSVSKAIKTLENWNVPKNRSKHGVVYQDGSIIYSALGDKPTGNKLNINETLGGRIIDFDGEDFLFVSPDGQFVSPS